MQITTPTHRNDQQARRLTIYKRQKHKMQRFKFRQPNCTSNVNFTTLNDYHIYLRNNPGIKTTSASFEYEDGFKPASPIGPAAYRITGKPRLQSVIYPNSVHTISPDYLQGGGNDRMFSISVPGSSGMGPGQAAGVGFNTISIRNSSPVNPLSSPSFESLRTPRPLRSDSSPSYEMYYPLVTPSPRQLQASCELRVYKKIIGNRDLLKEASVDTAHKTVRDINSASPSCRSTNYTCFRGPKLLWHNTQAGARRASLLTRDMTGAMPGARELVLPNNGSLQRVSCQKIAV